MLMAHAAHGTRRLFARAIAVVLGVVVAIVPIAPPASAGTGGGTDPTGDTVPTADCHPDITAFSGSYTDQAISFSTTTACSSNPNLDANWSQGKTEADWGLDVDGDGQIDFIAGVVNVNHYRAAVIKSSTNTIVCEGNAHWDGDKTFSADFAPSCFNDPASFRMQAFMAWDETAGQGTCTCPYDLAPDGSRLTGAITRTSPPPTFGYATACNRTDTAPGAFADAGLAADCLKAWGIAFGKQDGTFGEDDSLLRSQVSSLLERLLTTNGVPLTTRHTFPDVNPDTVPNQQVRDEIEHLAGAGIIAGFPNGTFGPAGTLSVAQAATFVVRTLHLLHAQLGTGPALVDQGSTSANYDYAGAQAILDQNAKDMNGTTYPSASADATMRGLLADMLAESLEKFGKVYYADCSEAQAAGVAPMAMGSPGYRPALDPGGTGSAC